MARKTTTDPSPATQPRRVEMMPLAELGKKGNKRNPKAHDLEVIDKSVGRFGYVEPVVLDERTGKIISGHGRTQTLADMHAREETPPEGVSVNDNGDWLVPVVRGWASRTDAEANAALISLNRSTELGGWDDTSLLDLLDELSDMDDGLEGIGFDDSDLEKLREQVEAASQVDCLSDLAEGAPSTSVNDTVVDMMKGEEVVLEFAVTREQRTQVLDVLNEHRKEHDMETISEALLSKLGLS